MGINVLIGNIAFYVAALLISGSCVFYTRVVQRRIRTKNRLFQALLWIVVTNSMLNIVSEFVIAFVPNPFVTKLVLHFTQYVYQLFIASIAPIFALYTLMVCGTEYRFSRRMRNIIATPFYIAEIMVLTNPITKFVYRLTDDFEIVRHVGASVIYLISAFYLLFSIAAVFLYWNVLNELKRVAAIYFYVLVIAGTAVQNIFPDIKCELLFISIGLVGLMIMFENDDDRVDVTTGAYNRNAFMKDVASYYKYGRAFMAIAIRISNGEVYRKFKGYEEYEKTMGIVAEYLNRINEKYLLYRLGSDCLFLICLGLPEDESYRLTEDIQRRFQEGWTNAETDIQLTARFMIADAPEQFAGLEYLLLLADSAVQENQGEILHGHDLDYLLRKADVQRAVSRGLAQNSFTVMYEPIYKKEDNSITAAEAKLRLVDKELGYIPREEFRPMAEETGMIEKIGWFAIEEVFYFLGGGITEELGLEFIAIGVSSIQLIQPSFVEKMNLLVAKYGVRPESVAFAITESAAGTDQIILGTVIRELTEEGFRFFMDEYGTGYFSMQAASQLNFEGVIMDAELLRRAMKVPQNRVVLENRLRMMTQMERKIILRNVQSQEYLDLIDKSKAAYLQGQYFSETVSKNELIAILRATELARMEERRARAASEAKSNFLANMSHEIRTPINAVLGMNEVILRESTDENIRQYAQNIEGAGRTLLSLINDILDFSKIEAGSMEITEAEYDFSSVLNDVYNMVFIKAQQKELELKFQIQETLPDTLMGDETRLRQILVNVLNNAVKYTMEGSVSLAVAGEEQQDDTVLLHIDITDTGVGIKPEDMDSLFDKFKRLDVDKHRKVEGSGLGLSITSNLLKMMGGSITADSTYGKGSVFHITLPQKVVGSGKIGDFKSRIEKMEQERKMYQRKFVSEESRILVVDDTPMNHVVVTELLKPTKIQIDSARSGKEGIAKQHETKYDVIFLDYRMPEMDGVETLEEMRADKESPNKDTPIIALTANAITGSRENFLRAGFDDYLSKPIDSEKLEEMLLRYLPKGKIHTGTVTDVKAEEEDTKQDLLQDLPEWLQKLTELDVRAGIKNCGSIDSYQSILKVYFESIPHSKENIRKTFQDKNLKDYTSYVHSLKSTSRTIGAMKISKLAEKMEKAGDKKDIESIIKHTDELLSMYEALEQKLQTLPEIAGNEQDDVEYKEKITSAQLSDAYKSMLEVGEKLDYDTLQFILDSLKTYQLPEKDEALVREIKDLSYHLDWDGMRSAIRKRLEQQE